MSGTKTATSSLLSTSTRVSDPALSHLLAAPDLQLIHHRLDGFAVLLHEIVEAIDDFRVALGQVHFLRRIVVQVKEQGWVVFYYRCETLAKE